MLNLARFSRRMQRISCVHSQVLEAGNKRSGGVTCLIYYKGLLFSGYTDGSIKVNFLDCFLSFFDPSVTAFFIVFSEL